MILTRSPSIKKVHCVRIPIYILLQRKDGQQRGLPRTALCYSNAQQDLQDLIRQQDGTRRNLESIQDEEAEQQQQRKQGCSGPISRNTEGGRPTQLLKDTWRNRTKPERRPKPAGKSSSCAAKFKSLQEANARAGQQAERESWSRRSLRQQERVHRTKGPVAAGARGRRGEPPLLLF